MTAIHRMTVGSVFAAMLLIPVGASSARADDDRWEDWREAQEERREELEEFREDQREAREEWREEQRERWEDYQDRLEDRAEEYGRVMRHAVPYYDDRSYAPLPPPHPYRVYRERVPEYRYYRPYYRPYYGRYYGTGRFGYFDYRRGGAVRVGPVWVEWD